MEVDSKQASGIADDKKREGGAPEIPGNAAQRNADSANRQERKDHCDDGHDGHDDERALVQRGRASLVLVVVGAQDERAEQDVHEQREVAGEEELVHLAPWDTFWGRTKKGVGDNMLGQMLMNLRWEFLNASTSTEY